MGRYSDNYTYKQMVKMGFLKPKEVPQKYKTPNATFWFAYYGTPYKNEEAEIHARSTPVDDNLVTLKTFSVRSKGKNYRLFKTAILLEE
jgi:hypothetical protein